MKKIYLIIVTLIIIGGVGLVLVGQDQIINKHNIFNNVNKELKEELPQLKSKQTEKQLKNHVQGDLFSWIGEGTDKLIKELGEPQRKDLSAYDYIWWVYSEGNSDYIQFGVEDETIKTIYTMGDNVSIKPFNIGDTYEDINDYFSIKRDVTYHDGLSFYTFKLNDDDLVSQPLIKLSNNTFVQCYFDTFTSELSSIRILTGDTLLKQQFYEMEYRGTIPETLNASDDKWEEVEEGLQSQIIALTNVLRERHEVQPLIWDENVSKVAYNHSKDMSIHNYFSHYGQDGSGLKERLAEKNVFYYAAGENIAAQHSDAPAAVHGWLNSEGHRDALLNKEYNYLGVGVYRLYYTQNFIFKP